MRGLRRPAITRPGRRKAEVEPCPRLDAPASTRQTSLGQATGGRPLFVCRQSGIVEVFGVIGLHRAGSLGFRQQGGGTPGSLWIVAQRNRAPSLGLRRDRNRHRASPARRFRHLRSGYRRLLRLQSVDRDDRLACPCIGYIKVSPRLRLDGQGFAHVQRDKDVKIARVGRNGRRRKTACLRLLAIRASSILGVGAVRSKDHIASK
jgi:hypothetical protein